MNFVSRKFPPGLLFQFTQFPLLLVLVCICGSLSFHRPPHFPRFFDRAENFPGWPAAPIPFSNLKAISLDQKTLRFAADFPGKIAVFSDGRKTWIVRWVFTPTRKLHPSSDCLRAAGYRIKPARASLDSRAELWSTSLATRQDLELKVCERIVGSHGGEWTDVSSWFWQTSWDHRTGPWWSITTLDPL